MDLVISGVAYVLGDAVDTDQILPGRLLTGSFLRPDERADLGRGALSGVPWELAGLPRGRTRFLAEGESRSGFKIVIGGWEFGCGSSREHAVHALAAAGVELIAARSFGRTFFRNAAATGALALAEYASQSDNIAATGDKVAADLALGLLTHLDSGRTIELRVPEPMASMLAYGGLFGYARHVGMIPEGRP